MANEVKNATVSLWGRTIGAVIWDARRDLGVFSYDPQFARSNIQVAPLTMPLGPGNFEFPSLPRETFKGLPGLLADSLPDKFGNLLIDQWLARQGRSRADMTPVERLCYIGSRGMGALEFQPATFLPAQESGEIEIERMVALASDVLAQRETLTGHLGGESDGDDLRDILRIGTSAGGARAKAVLAWNRQTGEFRSGQVDTDAGYEHWLLKFDGVSGNRDKELADPMGYGRLEYACYLIAQRAGIEMAECRLHEEGGRAHFMTRRFDRDRQGHKTHMLSLCAMRHFDFNIPRAYSYEQAIETMRLLDMPQTSINEQLRRAFLNILIRNQDDHVKNIAYMMGRRGRWTLSPAFDVCYAYNPTGDWTSQHQMSLNGKTDGFTLADLMEFARFCDVKTAAAMDIYNRVRSAVEGWDKACDEAGVPKVLASRAKAGLRLALPNA